MMKFIPPDPGLGAEEAVGAVADDIRGPGAGVCADGGGAGATGGPPLSQQLGVKVGMPLGVFTEKRKKMLTRRSKYFCKCSMNLQFS